MVLFKYIKILQDKTRLLERTRVKRSVYDVLGEEKLDQEVDIQFSRIHFFVFSKFHSFLFFAIFHFNLAHYIHVFLI